MRKIINVGIVAHVDAGKTTLTEQLLFAGGAIRSIGSVDKGSSITDSLELERQRGISIKASSVSFDWNETRINLIDTPGHADFSSEVQRVLSVLDMAILVLSAVEGVQAHTLTIWDALRKHSIPTLLFINKIDRSGADFETTYLSIKKELSPNLFPLFCPNHDLTNIENVWNGNEIQPEYSALKDASIEQIAELNENLLLRYLDDEKLSYSDLEAELKTQIQAGVFFPVLCGIAKESVGISELLSSIDLYFTNSLQDLTLPAAAYVYKVEHHKLHGRLAHIRLYQGILKSRTEFTLNNKTVKATQVKKQFTHKLEDLPKIEAGDIGIISGIPEIQAGDFLGDSQFFPPKIILQQPLVTVEVKAILEKDYNSLAAALEIINSEDPSLAFEWFKEEQEMQLRLMGPMQTEIIQEDLLQRFGIQTSFEPPSIIYKERPVSKAEGFIRYWMPKPCWAILTFQIEPLPVGSGVVYESLVGVNDVAKKYQNEIEKTIPYALKQGIKGWEITDVKITLLEGEDHEMHSRPGDFALATPMGILRALENANSELLEPVVNFTIKAQEEYLGKITSDITSMRGQFNSPDFEGDSFILTGTVPAATSLEYGIQVSSITSGKGRYQSQFEGYQLCPPKEGQEIAFKGVSPLDESQWILHRRGAFKANDR